MSEPMGGGEEENRPWPQHFSKEDYGESFLNQALTFQHFWGFAQPPFPAFHGIYE